MFTFYSAQIYSIHIFTMHKFTVHIFTMHKFTVHIFTIHKFTVHIFTMHKFTVHIFAMKINIYFLKYLQCIHFSGRLSVYTVRSAHIVV